MALKRRHVIVIHGLTTKFAPFLWMLSVFFFFSPFTEQYANFDFQATMISIAFFLGGTVFIYEGIYTIPKNKDDTTPLVGAVFFFFMGGLSIIVGILNFPLVGLYNFATDQSVIKGFTTFVLVADMGITFIGTVWETIMSRRLSHQLSGKPKLKLT